MQACNQIAAAQSRIAAEPIHIHVRRLQRFESPDQTMAYDQMQTIDYYRLRHQFPIRIT